MEIFENEQEALEWALDEVIVTLVGQLGLMETTERAHYTADDRVDMEKRIADIEHLKGRAVVVAQLPSNLQA